MASEQCQATFCVARILIFHGIYLFKYRYIIKIKTCALCNHNYDIMYACVHMHIFTYVLHVCVLTKQLPEHITYTDMPSCTWLKLRSSSQTHNSDSEPDLRFRSQNQISESDIKIQISDSDLRFRHHTTAYLSNIYTYIPSTQTKIFVISYAW